MQSLAEKFHALDSTQKRVIHFRLCRHSLERWRGYVHEVKAIRYFESVVGTRQEVDTTVPDDAFASAGSGRDRTDVKKRYQEPIAAMQDDDLRFPDEIRFAYYSLYNLFRRYALHERVDDGLIVNQALSSASEECEWIRLLREAIDSATTTA